MAKRRLAPQGVRHVLSDPKPPRPADEVGDFEPPHAPTGSRRTRPTAKKSGGLFNFLKRKRP